MFQRICDIEEKAGEQSNDFLFLADITGDGDASGARTQKTDGTGAFVGRCIFSSVMYDVNSFKPDGTYDGLLNFEIAFGARTAERAKDAPNGWTVQFVDLQGPDPATRRYVGKIKTSWWGERNVTLIPYGGMSDSEKGKFPDLKAAYSKSRGTTAGGGGNRV